MKRVVIFWMAGLVISAPLVAQKPSDDRMKRDIAVMETALSAMIKQEFDQRSLFFMDVKGNYVPGYGVTFTVPTSIINNFWTNGVITVDGVLNGTAIRIPPVAPEPPVVEEITERESRETKAAMKGDKQAQKEREKAERAAQAADKAAQEANRVVREAERTATAYGFQSGNGVHTYTYSSSDRNRKRINSDSMNAVNNAKIIEAAKTFIADYGDMLSQLAPNERIVVTNRGAHESSFWFNGQKAKRSLLSVEATKSDLLQFRQGAITRDQLLANMKVVNTTTSEKAEPDMELLASIFNRLYREDLSNTYYVQSGVSYERLSDFGAILYMQVVSSVSSTDYYAPAKEVRLSMPTQGLTNLTQEERDKKVKELYPQFERELKENLLDYGRTLKSLHDNEQLMVDVTLTKCAGCGIPASLELAVKVSVLKDFNAGKLDRSAALSKIEVKKGAVQ